MLFRSLVPRLRSTNLPVAISARRSGLSLCRSAEVFTVDGLFMSIGLAHRDDANVVFNFRSDDRDQRIAERPQRHESFLAVVEATILECDNQPGLNHVLGVDQVKTMLLAVARLLCGIEAVANIDSMCMYMCIVKAHRDVEAGSASAPASPYANARLRRITFGVTHRDRTRGSSAGVALLEMFK